MLLALDVGNTNVTVGVFKREELVATWRAKTDIQRQADEYAVILLTLLQTQGLDPKDITDSVLASVVPPLTTTFQELCRQYFKADPLVVETGVRSGISILYDNPRDVGADRVADSAAAYHLYGGPVIVLDFGTATVLDAISKDGQYLGGAIAPGIGIAAEALFTRASKLPRVELVRPKTAIGRNTVASIQSGLIFGYVGLIEGLITRFQREMGGNAKVIATGGLANIVGKESKLIDEVNLDLTLIGLRIIYELNRPPQKRPA